LKHQGSILTDHKLVKFVKMTISKRSNT